MECVSFLGIGMKTSLASELAGGIAYPTLNSLIFSRPGVVFVGQSFGQLQVLERSYQAFEKPSR